ncbi:hypothetical protein SO802_000329 [Lithocarpus litseifolius]|uniref:Protein kinase domain-containing protein n=1 Tax=Lithocarpus litseifolius TaxID=425828 RepID=A0AAW2DRA5_9ROSI
MEPNILPISLTRSKGDSYYVVSTNSFENLANWHVLEDMNPTLDPSLLHIGVEVIFPLFFKCPSKQEVANGIQNLITYVWQPADDVLQVSAKFNATAANIEDQNYYQNFSTAVGLPVLIPMSQLPAPSQPYPFQQYPPKNHSKHLWILIVIISLVGAILILLLSTFLVYAHCLSKRKKTIDRTGSSLETSELIQMKEKSKGDDFEHKSIQSKLLAGVSGYLSKPIMYETKTIMEATMNLSEQCKIGGSVYKATINEQVLAVKKIKEDVTEELKILQKVNHANLVKLMGTAPDEEGNHFLVYEYVERGSLRLNIALDVANGLHYMHEHTQPTIVHRDIRAANILLDSKFKAKIANFSMARSATNSLMPTVDVFAFGVVLLELLSGKKATETKENGEVDMLWKDIRLILEVEENKEERLRKWIDPHLERFYPIEGVLSLAALARACTLDKSSAKPSMAEIVFSLSVLTQSSPEASEGSWTAGIEGTEITHAISPITAR